MPLGLPHAGLWRLPRPSAREGACPATQGPGALAQTWGDSTLRFDRRELSEPGGISIEPILCASEAPIGGFGVVIKMLTRKAGLPDSGSHDLRHCAITSFAESGAADSTIMAIAGHVSRRMLERYSHVRMEAKRTAMESLSKGSEMGV